MEGRRRRDSMKSRLIPAFVLASGVCLATAACSKHDDTSDTNAAATEAPAVDTAATPAATDTAAAASSQAAAFLTDAMKGDNSEVRVGQLAQTKGSSQGVKDFGKMLESD